MTTALELRNITKSYGSAHVLDALNLKVEEGEFICLLGPSGCGKTTLLRIIAGLLEPSTGEVVIRGRDVTALSPSARNIAMVFQSYALYPHKTVWENIAFPLRMRGPAASRIPLLGRFLPAGRRVETEVRRLVPEAARMVGLEKLLSRRPAALSGGQKQRVALARALVRDPSLFLMDEPLSNLDAKLRTDTRREIVELHRKTGRTFIYVTHDQTEAMSMATKIVLMRDGEIQQADEPLRLYGDPVNRFTAQFIGTPTINVFPRDALPDLGLPESVAWVGFRPSRALLREVPAGTLPDGSPVPPGSAGAVPSPGDLTFGGPIAIREVMGSEVIYQVKTVFGTVTFKTFNVPEIEVGAQVSLVVDRASLYLFDEDERRVRP